MKRNGTIMFYGAKLQTKGAFIPPFKNKKKHRQLTGAFACPLLGNENEPTHRNEGFKIKVFERNTTSIHIPKQQQSYCTISRMSMSKIYGIGYKLFVRFANVLDFQLHHLILCASCVHFISLGKTGLRARRLICPFC